MIYLDEKVDQLTGKRGVPDGKCCVEKRSAPKVLQEHGMKKKTARSMLWSADGDWRASKLAEERRKGGEGQECGMKSRSAHPGRRAPNPGRGALMGIEECSPRRGAPKWGTVRKECGIQYRSDNTDWGVLVGIEEPLSHAEEHGNGGIERGMK